MNEPNFLCYFDKILLIVDYFVYDCEKLIKQIYQNNYI